MENSAMRTLLEIVQECDNFPYPGFSSPNAYQDALNSLWLFYLPDDPTPHGILTDAVVARMPWTPAFHLATTPHKKVQLLQPSTAAAAGGGAQPAADWQNACTAAIQSLIDTARAQNTFPRLGKPTPEHFPVLGAAFPLSIERSAFSLFGTIGRGAHMTLFTRRRPDSTAPSHVWVARRSAAKATYPGMLDQAVAGGVARGETPWECVVREAAEEAGLRGDYVRERAVAAGAVSWWNVADERAGGEVGLMNPGVLYVYDLEVGGETAGFAPVEGDIERFRLMGVDEVLVALRSGEFKPSCAVVMLDFLVRHGLVTAENEPDYGEILSRLHRRLPFPMSPGSLLP